MILVHAAGNKNIGLGNLTRSSEIAKYIIDKITSNVIIIYETNKDIAKNFIVHGCITYVVKNREEARKVIDKIEKDEKNVVISDLIDMTYEDNIFYKSNNFKLLVQLNDSNVNKFNPDIYINSDAFIQSFDINRCIKRYSGIEYMIIKEEIKKMRPTNFINLTKISNVLICFGGADPGFYTEACLNEIINNKKYDNYKFQVILGIGFNKSRLNDIQTIKYSNIQYIINEKNMANRILKNDLVLTLGGLTTYEALFLGKPVAAMGWNYMNYYVEKLNEYNYVYSIGNNKNDFKNLKSCMQDIERLSFIAKNGFCNIDGNGAKNIVNVILNHMQKGN